MFRKSMIPTKTPISYFLPSYYDYLDYINKSKKNKPKKKHLRNEVEPPYFPVSKSMNLTKSKILDTSCPSCKAKEGQECSISGDVMMVKQFEDVHWSREQKAKQLMEFNNRPKRSRWVIKNNVLVPCKES